MTEEKLQQVIEKDRKEEEMIARFSNGLCVLVGIGLIVALIVGFMGWLGGIPFSVLMYGAIWRGSLTRLIF